jgi:mannose/cellobiose epimerase-like protein (N-acyl-D-glucosamine 2-epimerase family)
MHDPDQTAATPPTAATLRAHYNHVVLPIWRGPGFNTVLRLAFEAVAENGRTPLPPQRYRAMACARQLFVFSQAGDIDHADTLFASLRTYFQDTKNGGWFYSVDANGAPHERHKDLYTHAFVIFACAEYAKRAGSAAAKEALAVLEDTSVVIERRMAISAGGNGAGVDGLFSSAMTEDFSTALGPPLQNPLMHLIEAWLAAREATGDVIFDRRLEKLATAFAQAFVHEKTGCIAELTIGSANNWLEPGHQFEWLFLAEASRHPAFDAAGLNRALVRGFDFVQQHGVDPVTGGVAASLNEQGGMIDSTQRIWAQTEYLRALATHADQSVRALLPAQIARFSGRFIRPQGWIESQSAEGVVMRPELPSTTPYHLATAYAALP